MTCSWSRRIAAAALFLLVAAAPAPAAPLIVKMATLAPEGSSWYKALVEIGEEWKRISGGAVVLKLYPGGVVGDEQAMIRKMKVGQLQASALTGMGLAFIERSFYALSIPMFYASDEEYVFVRDRVAPMLERKLEEKGFVLLFWGEAGWVHFFANRPFMGPEDVKTMKLYVGAGDEPLIQSYKEVGFRPVPLSLLDILPGLQTGLIEAFGVTPLAALAFQWFALAPHTTDLRWAPLPGGGIIDRKTWEKIPADLRPKLLAASRAGGNRLRDEIRKLNEEAMRVMSANGLKARKTPPEARDEWVRLLEQVYPRVRGPIIPPDAFDAVKGHRAAYRALPAGGKGPAR